MASTTAVRRRSTRRRPLATASTRAASSALNRLQGCAAPRSTRAHGMETVATTACTTPTSAACTADGATVTMPWGALEEPAPLVRAAPQAPPALQRVGSSRSPLQAARPSSPAAGPRGRAARPPVAAAPNSARVPILLLRRVAQPALERPRRHAIQMHAQRRRRRQRSPVHPRRPAALAATAMTRPSGSAPTPSLQAATRPSVAAPRPARSRSAAAARPTPSRARTWQGCAAPTHQCRSLLPRPRQPRTRLATL